MNRTLLFAAGSSLLTLLTLAGLAACGDDPTVAPAASIDAAASPAETSSPASPKPGATPLPPLGEGIPDVSGCWRITGSDGFATGNQVDILRVSADGFVFAGPPARTKLVFKPDRSFTEVNFDEAHPFFPKDYVHSTGAVSADGNTLARTIDGEDATPQTLHRCATVQQRPLTPLGPDGPQPSASGLIDTGTPDTSASGSPQPIVLPSTYATPKPSTGPNPLTPTPKPTANSVFKPAATPTPRPSITPRPTTAPANDGGLETPEGSNI